MLGILFLNQIYKLKEATMLISYAYNNGAFTEHYKDDHCTLQK